MGRRGMDSLEFRAGFPPYIFLNLNWPKVRGESLNDNLHLRQTGPQKAQERVIMMLTLTLTKF